ncbi:MAG: hypothetical protein IPJ13_13515 [Saprospiraceae bacterium]|nr:hypothetical protein [Saprospiraceae bacterium]
MKAILIATLIAISIKSFGQDMQKYLSETKEMVTQKKYKEALERYIWFQDHALEYNKAMSGVRLSFCIIILERACRGLSTGHDSIN